VKAAAVPLVLVPALGAVQGGYSPDAWVWSGALAAWACGLAVVLSSSPGALRRAWPWVAATGALLLWTLLSALWSVNARQSVLESRRTLVYAAVVLALVLLPRRDTERFLVPATHLASTGLLVYALARYLLGTRRYDEFEQYLLQQPLGYANAVGILSVLGLLLALGIVSSGAPRTGRAAAAASVPVLALTLDLSHSTASLLALGVGLAVLALLVPATLRLVAAGVALLPAAAIAVGAGEASRFAAVVATPRIPGWAVALVVAACAAFAAGAVARIPLPAAQPPSQRLRLLLIGAVVAVALGGAVAVAHSGTAEPRASYYHVAWHDEFLAHPLGGTGAGTFGHYWASSGNALDKGGALDAHSLYLETLAELGPLGLLLLLAMLLAPLRGALARRRAPYVPAAVGAYAAFLVHAGLDWDWELPAVVVAALSCAAAGTAAGLEPGRPLGRAVRGALLAVSAAFAACAIAGARSNTIPAAAPETTRAPRCGALSQTRA
jgi:O-antigen ligase